MSGSIAAIAAYDGTGTQGHGTTDKSLPGVKSVFWNENDTTKYYVNGCSFSEVSSNNSEIPSSQASNPGTVVFTFDNDTDAINDLVLTIGAENIQSSKAPSPEKPLPPWFMAGFIERIEICIGNQVISTIFTTQIKQLLISDKCLNLSVRDNGNVSQIGHGSNGGVYTNIKLPIFNLINSKTNCSYLMACANNQVLQVKVYPQFLTQSDYNTNFLASSSKKTITTDKVSVATGNYSGLITSDDHGFDAVASVTYASGGGAVITGLVDGGIYSVIVVDADDFKLAETTSPTTAIRLTGTGNDAQTFAHTASLWNIKVGTNNKFTFNLYANKYSMTNSERDFLRSQVIPKRTNVTQSATISNPQTIPGYPNLSTSIPITIICDHFNINAEKLYITSIGAGALDTPLFNVELFLNSTSYCGTIQSSVSEISMGPTYSQYISTTNAAAASAGKTISTDMEACEIAEIYFAKNSKEYNTDQNYVPLSKYDSIRIVLTPLSSPKARDKVTRFLDYLTVVVEGKCTALYQDGAVVFNNY